MNWFYHKHKGYYNRVFHIHNLHIVLYKVLILRHKKYTYKNDKYKIQLYLLNYCFGGQRVSIQICFSNCICVVALAFERGGVESVGTWQTAGSDNFGRLASGAFGTGSLKSYLQRVRKLVTSLALATSVVLSNLQRWT